MKLILAAALCAFAAPAFAMEATLGAPWDGKKVPKGQQCRLHGGTPSTPPITVSGIPAGTAFIIGEFNDRDYAPLSTKGGHGTISWPVKGAKATLGAIDENAATGKGGAQAMKKARSTGEYASKGYLAPCSGGRGNRYFVDLKAVDAKGKVLDKVRVEMGRY